MNTRNSSNSDLSNKKGKSASDYNFPLFPHQVAGHGRLRAFQPGYVIKPLIPTEARFYSFLNPSKTILFSPSSFPRPTGGSTNINASLFSNTNETPSPQPHFLEFTPSFHGILHVKASESMKPPVSASPLALQSPQAQPSSQLQSPQPVQLQPPHLQLQPLENQLPSPQQSPSQSPSQSPQQQVNDQPHNSQSPYQHIQIIDYLSKRSKQMKNRSPGLSEYLILEDVSFGLDLPCMLDLKMGTRLHGIYATPEKAKRSESKCRQSTLADTGIRVDGMKVYDPETGKYSTTSKTYGSSLTKATLASAFHRFLCCKQPFSSSSKTTSEHSTFVPHMHTHTTTTTTTHHNTQSRTHLLSSLLAQLLRLQQIISSLVGYRFFSCSLLLMYDASAPATTARVRIVDFAKTVFLNEQGDLCGGFDDSNYFEEQRASTERGGTRIKSHSSSESINLLDPDSGFLLGLQTVIGILEDIKHSCGESCASSDQ